jgi:Kdo2-lipid IVA lauroyltransferase/acyltransferase
VRAGFDDSATRHAAIAAAGKSILELPVIWFRPLARTLALVRETRGMEHVEQARAHGHGIIFLTPHLGCFELLSFWLAQAHPITVLYRPPRLGWLEPLMVAGRMRGAVQLAPTNLAGVRRLLKALRAREAIGLLPDQVPSFGEGEWIDFFGRSAYTMILPNRLQQVSDAVVVIVFAERLPRGKGYRVNALPLERLNQAPSLMHAVNQAIEDVVRTCPSQYLWAYNRYKVPAGAPLPGSSRWGN